ncbi:MAG TPA: acyl-CoA dehydrogenase family protein [Stellaceae bacterium]|jgi:3-hydroxy-9,10-secoandrosta-1,3,5(10)-triene-9,17-dione monooxygenase
MTADRGKQPVAGEPEAAEFVARARDLQPFLRAQAAQCETARRVSDEAIARLRTARLFDVVKPRRYGGRELGWDVFGEIVVALAAGCGSTGWVYSVVGGHAPVVARFGTRFLDELWGPKPDALLSSCRRASGELVPIDGGYRGSATGIFSSGVHHVDWVLIEGMPIAGRDRPVTIAVPRSEIEILDSWNVIGLAGTGSHDIRFDDVFVPDHRVWHPGKPPSGEALDGPLFRFPYLGGPFALPSVALGVAIAGLEHFVAMTHGRTNRTGASMAEQPAMQLRIGEAAVELDAALALLRAKLKEMASLAGETHQQAGERKFLLPGGVVQGYDSAVSCFIAQSAYRALDRLMVAAGAHQLAYSEPFQRCFRDVLAALQQPGNNWDNGRIAGGRALLDRIKP